MALKAIIATLILTLWGLLPHASNAESLEDVLLWRVQLKADTCAQENAGTNHHVWVQLTDSESEQFWLDKGASDRSRGGWDLWDVVIPSVSHVRDITQISFGTTGGRWCFNNVELRLNHNFGSADTAIVFVANSSTPWWLDNRSRGSTTASVQVADWEDLRAGERWNLEGSRRRITFLPLRIRSETLESIIEGLMGHLLGPDQQLEQLRWGKKKGRAHVAIRRIDGAPDNVVRVDLDLNLGGRKSRVRAVDVDFDLRVVCDDGDLRMDVVNVDADLSRALNALTGGLASVLEVVFERVGGIGNRLGVISAEAPFCQPPKFEDDLTLTFL